MTAPVPVLLVTGPVGVGKTVVTGEAARLLSEAGIPHAMADLAVIGAWRAGLAPVLRTTADSNGDSNSNSNSNSHWLPAAARDSA